MSRSSRDLYHISWISTSGFSEHTFESDVHDAIDVALANDGIISFASDDYTPDELMAKLEKWRHENESPGWENGIEFPWRVES